MAGIALSWAGAITTLSSVPSGAAHLQISTLRDFLLPTNRKTAKADPKLPASKTRKPAPGPAKSIKPSAKKQRKGKLKLTAKQTRELAARQAMRRRVLWVVGDYALGLAMLAGAAWRLIVFLGKR